MTLPAFLAGAALGIALYRVAGPEAPFWAGFVILVIVVAREIDDAARNAAHRRRVAARWARWEGL